MGVLRYTQTLSYIVTNMGQTCSDVFCYSLPTAEGKPVVEKQKRPSWKVFGLPRSVPGWTSDMDLNKSSNENPTMVVAELQKIDNESVSEHRRRSTKLGMMKSKFAERRSSARHSELSIL